MAEGFGSSFQEASDIIYDYTCSPCEEDRLNAEASFYCTKCFKQYCDSCVKFHEKIHRDHRVLTCKDISKWRTVKKAVAMETCGTHTDKELEMFCADHDQICCTICVSVNHRTCKLVKHVPEVAKGIHSNAEFKNLPTRAAKTQSKLDDMLQKHTKNRQDLQDKCQEIVASLKALRDNVDHIMDELEKRTLEEMDQLLALFDERIQDDVDSCTNIIDNVKRHLDNIEKRGKLNEVIAFAWFKNCNEKLKEAEQLLETTAGKGDYKIAFNVNMDIEEYLSTLTTLGTIQGIPDIRNSIQQKWEIPGDHVYTVEERKTYNVRMKNDNRNCEITGICQLPDRSIILVDEANRKVKQVDKNFNITSSISIDCVHDVCRIADSEMIVSFTDWQKTHGLQFINAKKGKLESTRKMHLDHSCCELQYHDGKIYVGSKDAIYLYKPNGQLIKKVYEDKSSTSTLWGFQVSDDGKNIYVVNNTTATIITLDNKGNELACLCDRYMWDSPTGICLAGNGSIFVCSDGSKTVVQIDRTGKMLTKLASEADGLNRSKSLWFDRSSSTLVVGQGDGTIVVLKLK